MLCEAKTNYISNMEIYTAPGKKDNVSTRKQFRCPTPCVPGQSLQ